MSEPRVRDEFERLAELGRGASGVVFAARHKTTGQEVAIKSLVGRVDDPKARERFLREGRVRIDSPHVVQVLDVRIEEGQVYLIQELVRGSSVEARLAQGPLPLAEALRIGEGVASALAAAHKAGYVHRDVKPANILIAEGGLVKLSDFGIAKAVAAGDVSLTASGQGMGTLTYVAPEQAQDAKRVSPAADLYGLGATLYHLIAGRPPFKPGPTIITRLFTEDPQPLRELRADCPRKVSSFVAKLLEKHPGDRPPHATRVARRLGELRKDFA